MRKNNPLHNMLSLPPATQLEVALHHHLHPKAISKQEKTNQNKSFWTATKLFWVSFATWWQRPRNDSVFLHFLFLEWSNCLLSFVFRAQQILLWAISFSYILTYFFLPLLIVPTFLNLATLQHLLLLVCLLSILLFMSSKPSDLNGGC